MDLIFFRMAMIAYLVSTAGYIASLFVGRVRVAKISLWVLLIALILHTVHIIMQLMGSQAGPSSNIYGSLSFIAWAVAGSYLAFQARTRTRVLGAFVSPVVVVMMVAASAGMNGGETFPSAMRGPLVPIHVVFLLTGGALFALACIAGCMYLVQDRLIRSKNVSGFSRLLPPLRDLDRMNHLCTVWGFPLLTFGIIAGAIWAQAIWGNGWYLDPKQVFTMASWLLCALVVHQRIAIGWKGRKAAFLSMIAFAGLLFAFIGVNAFFVTMHSF